MISVAEDLAGLLLKDRRHKANRESLQERKAHMKGIIKELLGWLIFIFIVVTASYLVITYVGQRTEVSGSSMESTLSDGDQLIVDKISYRFRDPSRYDIVVFHTITKRIHIILKDHWSSGRDGTDRRWRCVDQWSAAPRTLWK